MVILQKYVLGSVSVLPRQCPATLFRAFPKGGAGRPLLHCTAIHLYLVSQILCQRHSTLRSIPPLAMCYNFPVTSAKDSLKSYFCPISRWEGRCPVLRSSSKLVGNALQWQHTRETQITNGNIWSLPRWPAEQLPRKLILFSLFVLWAVFWDYDYGGRQILLCSRAPTRQIFVQIIWVKSE